MAEKSSDIIKFLFNMKVVATINHNIDKDTAEYIVKEFGHKPILEEKPSIKTNKLKEEYKGEVKISRSYNNGCVDHETSRDC